MPATLTTDAVRAFLATRPEFDTDDVDATKYAIRGLLGLKRVSTELYEQFVELAAEIRDEEAFDDEDEAEEESEGRSKVKKSYKRKYKPFKQTCGDDLAALVSAHVKVKTEDGLRIDLDKLRTFAVANACWVATYENLNPGMQRMNIVNRLRARVRKGTDIVWA